jgi:prolyl-tRNA synthetase
MALDGDACPKCKAVMKLVHGIEVGHVFKLGTKYSVALAAEFLDEKEQRHPMIMGCYGIGVNRIVAGLAETSFDDNGLIFPLSLAPYEVLVIPLNVTDPETMALAEQFYKELGAAGVDVLLDDRDARAGFKFKDADLIGIPLRIVIGGKGLKEGQVEVKWRDAAGPVKVPIIDAIATVHKMLGDRRRQEAAAVPA